MKDKTKDTIRLFIEIVVAIIAILAFIQSCSVSDQQVILKQEFDEINGKIENLSVKNINDVEKVVFKGGGIILDATTDLK